MITKRTHLGNITVSKQFFSELIGNTIVNCFGVAGMNSVGAKPNFLEVLPFIPKKNPVGKGVYFKIVKDKLRVELHITVMYGVNASAVVKSIQNKIKYAVEEETDVPVERVNVFIEGIKGG